MSGDYLDTWAARLFERYRAELQGMSDAQQVTFIASTLMALGGTQPEIQAILIILRRQLRAGGPLPDAPRKRGAERLYP